MIPPKAKKLPNSPGAERYLITACLRDPNTLVDFSGILSPSDFFYNIYSYSYQICLSLLENGMTPEPMTVYNKLESMGVAKPEHLKELELLSKATFDKSNVSDYVHVIKKCSVQRQLISSLGEAVDELTNKDWDSAYQAVDYCEDKVLTISNKLSNVIDVYRIGSNSLEVLTERAASPLEVPGLPTGFPALDHDLQGLQPGRLYVLTARQKVGKSVFLLNVVKNIAINHKIPVLMIDTEMPSQQVDDRMMSLLTGIEEQKLRNGLFQYDEAAATRISKALDQLETAEIYHHYMPDFSFESCMSLVKKYKMQKNIGLVVFDYIKVPDNSDMGAVKEYQTIGYLTSNLKNKIAGALNIPVLTAAQLGRSAIGAVDSSDEHIADSDRIGRYADTIIYFREKTEQEKVEYGAGPHVGNMIATIHINRAGPSKERAYDLFFDKPIMSMREVKARKLS